MKNYLLVMALLFVLPGCHVVYDFLNITIAQNDTVSTAISGDPANGEILFTTFQPEVGIACSTCHFADKEDRLIGPGLFNIATRAETQIAGQSAVEYVTNSILNLSDFVVQNYVDMMPHGWETAFTEEEFDDLLAYLFSLQ